jgi:hypothetical protein
MLSLILALLLAPSSDHAGFQLAVGAAPAGTVVIAPATMLAPALPELRQCGFENLTIRPSAASTDSRHPFVNLVASPASVTHASTTCMYSILRKHGFPEAVLRTQ